MDAAGGPSGVQDALNQKLAPQGISLQGPAFGAGQDSLMQPQQKQPYGYLNGTCGTPTYGYASGTTGGLTINDPKKLTDQLQQQLAPPAPTTGLLPQQQGATAATPTARLATRVDPIADAVKGMKSATSAKFASSPAPAAIAPVSDTLTLPSANPAPTTPAPATQAPAPAAPAAIQPVAPAPQTNYVQQQLANPINQALRQDTMQQIQKQQGANDIIQGQKLAEAGVDPNSAAGRTAMMEQQVAREDTTGQAVADLNKQAMSTMKSDAVNTANAQIAAGDYEGANKTLASVGQAPIDFTQVKSHEAQGNDNAIADYFDGLAKAATANGDDTTAQAMTKLSSQYRTKGFQAVMGADFDPGIVTKALDDIEAGSKTPEATALHQTADTVHSFFANDPAGQSALATVIDAPELQGVLSSATSGDAASAHELGDVLRAVYNQENLGLNPENPLSQHDVDILEKYGLTSTAAQRAGTATVNLGDDIGGSVQNEKRHAGVSGNFQYSQTLKNAKDTNTPVTYNGKQYKVVKTYDGLPGAGRKSYVEYVLVSPDGDIKMMTTRYGTLQVDTSQTTGLAAYNRQKDTLVSQAWGETA
jgi:hypothetical protein